MKLVGKELQNHDCGVFLQVASHLYFFHIDYFPGIAKQAGSKTYVLLLDEVQNNMNREHWNTLLKDPKPANLLVIGVGVPNLVDYSPQFSTAEGEPSPCSLRTDDDMPEVCAHFD